VQAALFAGLLSAFLIALLSGLEPEQMDITQDALVNQTQMMCNSSLGSYVPAGFFPPEYIVVVNPSFYASLGITFLVVFISMVIKSWVREFDRGLRAKTRELPGGGVFETPRDGRITTTAHKNVPSSVFHRSCDISFSHQ